jgi:hypothetical protein
MRTSEQRFHDLTHNDDMPIAKFRAKLLDRQIMAMRAHARWAARRVANQAFQQGYSQRDKHLLSDVYVNNQLRHYSVDSAMFGYGRKVFKEKFEALIK